MDFSEFNDDELYIYCNECTHSKYVPINLNWEFPHQLTIGCSICHNETNYIMKSDSPLHQRVEWLKQKRT
jgi:hypothetical protein